MKIPSNTIKEYLLSKFENYHVAYDEFLIDSFFCEDTSKHLSVNINTGLWQCFKSKNSGNFIHLVSFVEGVPYSDAHRIVAKKLLDNPEYLFISEDLMSSQEEITEGKALSEQLKYFVRLPKIMGDLAAKTYPGHGSSLSEYLAIRFAKARKLPLDKLYFATGGKYANRIIVPYEYKGSLVYFQARQVLNVGMKYLNPTYKEYGIKASEILFPYDEKENYVIVTEGPMDSLVLQDLGVNATSIQGSNMSRTQAKELKSSKAKVILSFDNDEPGSYGMEKAVKILRSIHVPDIYVARPPSRFKDWGDFRVASTPDGVLKHLSSNVIKYDYEYKLNELLG